MCDYTQVNYQCGHVRYIVKAWCVRYQQTHERCAPNVVATWVTPERIPVGMRLTSRPLESLVLTGNVVGPPD